MGLLKVDKDYSRFNYIFYNKNVVLWVVNCLLVFRFNNFYRLNIGKFEFVLFCKDIKLWEVSIFIRNIEIYFEDILKYINSFLFK